MAAKAATHDRPQLNPNLEWGTVPCSRDNGHGCLSWVAACAAMTIGQTTGVRLGLVRVLCAIAFALVVLSPASAVEPKRETIEADVSTRDVSVGSDFTGTRVIVFGTIENSRQSSAADRVYDVAVVIVGPREGLVARRKTNDAGLWINTSSFRFRDVPSYYAVLSTRPVKDIASRPVLWQHGVGFENMRIVPDESIGATDAEQFRSAVVRVKKQQGLYREEPKGVAFIGRSLFRASVDLPANISVGEFTAWVYLFEKGDLITTYKTRLGLQRDGFESALHGFAMNYPLLYGIAAVSLALLAGFAATWLFRRD
jgi:uncharacterized protein (TIGR02186 family)